MGPPRNALPSRPCTTPPGGRRRARRPPSSTGTVPRRRGCAPSGCCTVWCWESSVPRTARGCSIDSEAGTPTTSATASRDQRPGLRRRSPARGLPSRGRCSGSPLCHAGTRTGAGTIVRSEHLMNLSAGVGVHLLGRPRIAVDGTSGYRFRSRKSWALLAFLLLAERPPTRSRLASLLFAEADDPLSALRWCLAEVRRGLGPVAVLDGDPVRLTLPVGATVDVDVVVHGHWNDALRLP